MEFSGPPSFGQPPRQKETEADWERSNSESAGGLGSYGRRVIGDRAEKHEEVVGKVKEEVQVRESE